MQGAGRTPEAPSSSWHSMTISISEVTPSHSLPPLSFPFLSFLLHHIHLFLIHFLFTFQSSSYYSYYICLPFLRLWVKSIFSHDPTLLSFFFYSFLSLEFHFKSSSLSLFSFFHSFYFPCFPPFSSHSFLYFPSPLSTHRGQSLGGPFRSASWWQLLRHSGEVLHRIRYDVNWLIEDAYTWM